jgi:hypothetical protein
MIMMVGLDETIPDPKNDTANKIEFFSLREPNQIAHENFFNILIFFLLSKCIKMLLLPNSILINFIYIQKKSKCLYV